MIPVFGSSRGLRTRQVLRGLDGDRADPDRQIERHDEDDGLVAGASKKVFG